MKNNNWEKEFDKKYGFLGDRFFPTRPAPNETGTYLLVSDDLKQFIQSLLDEQVTKQSDDSPAINQIRQEAQLELIEKIKEYCYANKNSKAQTVINYLNRSLEEKLK